jgi:hypothetical protein
MKYILKYYRNRETIKDIDPESLWVLSGEVLRHVDIDSLTEVDYAANCSIFYEYLPPSNQIMDCTKKELLEILDYYWVVTEDAQQLSGDNDNESLVDDLTEVLESIDNLRRELLKHSAESLTDQKVDLIAILKNLHRVFDKHKEN